MLVVASLATPAMAAKAKTTIKLDQKGTVKLELGKTLTITATVTPEGDVKWKSSKASVASVEGGVVTAHKEGTATITAKVGKKSAKVKIKVFDPTKPTKLTLKEGKKKTLTAGDTLQLTPVLSPDTAVSEYTYKSSKKSVASVDGNGLVTTHKKGTAKITVTSKKNKKAKATFTVKVLAAPKPADGKDLSVCIGKNAKQVMDAYGLKQTGEKLQNGVTIYTLATDGIEMMAGGKSLDTATVYYLRVYGAAGAKFNIQGFNLTSMTYKQATAKAKKDKFTITYDNLFPDCAVLTTEKGDKRLIVYAKNRDSIVNQLVYRTKLDPK